MEKKIKKCLLLTNHFYPETFRCNDIAFNLVDRGYDVTVLTGIPDYPLGKFHEGYSLFKKRYEVVNGVKIIRVPLIPRGNGKAIRMIIQYASSIFSSSFMHYTKLFSINTIVYSYTTPLPHS